MKNKKLTIKISKPAQDVFAFTTNPKNTSKWVSSITTEKTNEWPPKLGTVYKNQDKNGNWSEYKITEFEKDKMFVMSKKDGNYHVKYTFTLIGNDSCKLEYYEWVDSGQLEEPFTLEILEKLKSILEK